MPKPLTPFNRDFKYSQEVSKYFNVKCSPITRITEQMVLREKHGITLLFDKSKE